MAEKRISKKQPKKMRKKQKARETVKKMLEKNMKLEDIIDITGISKDELQKIEDNL